MRTLAVAALAAILSLPGPAGAQKHADPAKVLRVMFPVAETGFDPQATSDLYSGHVQRAIFEPLYAYDYLARPYKLVPNTAAALPEISADGRTWTIRIRPGHPLRRRPGVQGEEARADRARLRLRLEAAARPEGALAVPVVPRRQARRRATRCLRRRRRRAGSTTTRRSRACARSTGTRCRSSWSSPTTC